MFGHQSWIKYLRPIFPLSRNWNERQSVWQSLNGANIQGRRHQRIRCRKGFSSMNSKWGENRLSLAVAEASTPFNKHRKLNPLASKFKYGRKYFCVKFITSERTRTRNTYYLCSFTASRFVICMAYETCECVCVFFFPPKPNANRMENKIELYKDEMSLHVLFCLALASSGLCRAKTLLFFGFIRGVSVAVHTAHVSKATHNISTHDNILHTIWACKHVWQGIRARDTKSPSTLCRHSASFESKCAWLGTHWVRSIRRRRKNSERVIFFFFFLPPPTVMPDMCRLFITRMFIFISFHHHCRWNATAALQKPIFSFVIMCRFAL